jgi:hypothetical protein
MGRESSFEKDLTHVEWAKMYNMAKIQTLLGVLNDGIHRLPEHQLPPDHVLDKWDHLTVRIAEMHRNHERRLAELEGILKERGLQGCILKGTGLSHLYPNPERRMSGDIDLWIKGPRSNTIRAFASKYKVHDIIYQECKVDIFDDVTIEVHFHPAKLNNPFLNARLQRCLEQNAPFRDGETLVYPDARFNAVFCMAHMFRHYLEGGIGMRQMMDYYYVLMALDPADRKPVMKTLKRLGMKRFTASVMTCVQYNFGLEDEYLLCPPDKKHGGRLTNDVFNMGNFGVMDMRNYTYDGETKWATFRRKNRRVFSNLSYYPREVLWSPFARISQFVWRKIKGYI